MQKDTHGEEYELFFMELPQSDYFLTDIPIQDAYDDSDDNTDTNTIRGLSDKQVSELADDQLGQHQQQPADPNLFSDHDHHDS